jgi:hypothetical protein
MSHNEEIVFKSDELDLYRLIKECSKWQTFKLVFKFHPEKGKFSIGWNGSRFAAGSEYDKLNKFFPSTLKHLEIFLKNHYFDDAIKFDSTILELDWINQTTAGEIAQEQFEQIETNEDIKEKCKFKTRAELLSSIATTIRDYRAGEIAAPTVSHVDRWVSQFDVDGQLPLLAEVDYVLDKTYFSREYVKSFFEREIINHPLAQANPREFWEQVNFLNIQKNGQSQQEILKLFADSLRSQCGLELEQCGSPEGPFFYIDDVLFSGSRVQSDLKSWVHGVAPASAEVHIFVIGAHRLGEWQCKEGLKAAAIKASKTISFDCWAAIRFENRKSKKNISEVLWPAVVPSEPALTAYMELETRFPFEPRTAGGVLEHPVFSSEAGRQLVERELLLAGVRIRARCQNPSPVIRPLGFGSYGLGFGSTIVTYRNCPNNVPLALWWGDAKATSGAMHWYPLLPRKTYAQAGAMADFKFDL